MIELRCRACRREYPVNPDSRIVAGGTCPKCKGHLVRVASPHGMIARGDEAEMDSPMHPLGRWKSKTGKGCAWNEAEP